MLSKKAAGMILSNQSHYIDHLAPLCSILDIPLLVTEPEVQDIIKQYYPPLTHHLIEDYHDITSHIATDFDVIFYCDNRILFDDLFFFQQSIMNKKIHTIWCPHGNSDKGHKHLHFETLRNEDYALLYGHQMADVLKKKKVLSHLKEYCFIGNYRKMFYEKHKLFYENIIKSKVKKYLPNNQTTVLYAPTWQDCENSTSFYDASITMLENLPDEYNLIIKPHPNILLMDPAFIENVLFLCEEKSNILLLKDFHAVYPLLDYIDIYLGDYSSIGYDFLSFHKPMFFLNQSSEDCSIDRSSFLHQCGTVINKDQYIDIFKIIKAFLPFDYSHFHNIRKQIDLDTFEPDLDIKQIKKNIEVLVSKLPDKELNFF